MTCQCIFRRDTPMVRLARRPDSSAVPVANLRQAHRKDQPGPEIHRDLIGVQRAQAPETNRRRTRPQTARDKQTAHAGSRRPRQPQSYMISTHR
jgi:hypothetical protein